MLIFRISDAASTTCKSNLAFSVSSSVALKASINLCGKWLMNPTVSARITGPKLSNSIRRIVGSNVAKSLSAT